MPYLSALVPLNRSNVRPVTTSLARLNARIDQGYDDELIEHYIDVATEKLENFLDRALITQTLQYSLVRTTEQNSWPLAPAPIFILPLGVEWVLSHAQGRDIGLLMNPVQSVSNVALGQWGEADTVLVEGTDYLVDYTVDPTRVHLINGNNWETRSHITITYTAGYGSDGTSVPPEIKQAILALVAWLYEHRGDTSEGIPEAIYNMCYSHRMVTFGTT